MWGLVAAAICIRLLFFHQLSATELIDLHRWHETDMSYYEGWGRKIAAGDWLSTSIGVPMHSWHVLIAQQYLGDHQNERLALAHDAASQSTSTTPEALLWSKWMGGHRFYEDPLYAYLIGVTYYVFGDDHRYVFAWQMALGVLTIVLIWLLTERFFGSLTAAWAGTMAVLCGPLIFYELLLLRESVIVFASLLLVWLTDRACTRGRPTWFGLLGFSTGLAVMLKTTFALLALAAAVVVIAHHRSRLRKLLAPACAAVLGLAIALAPLAARNLVLGVSPLALASGGPMTFVIANATDFPVSRGFSIDTRQVGRILGPTYDRPLATVGETLRAHSVAGFIGLLYRKWIHTWHWYEIPNNESFYYTRWRAPVLAWLPVTFWAVGSLGLIGIALAFGRRPWLLLALVGTALAPLIMFYVLGRFRGLLLAALIPFAALTITHLIQWSRTRRYRSLLATMAAIALLLIWVGRGRSDDQPLIRPSDWLVPYTVRYQAEAEQALQRQDPGRAAAALLGYFQHEPDAAQIAASDIRVLAGALATLHSDCARLLDASGQSALAQSHLLQAERLQQLATLGR